MDTPITPVEKLQLALLVHIAGSLNYIANKPPFHLDHADEHEQLRLDSSTTLNEIISKVNSLLHASHDGGQQL